MLAICIRTVLQFKKRCVMHGFLHLIRCSRSNCLWSWSCTLIWTMMILELWSCDTDYYTSTSNHTWQPELTCNIESLGCWWRASCSHSTALHHCPIDLSSGSEHEGGCQVCQTIHVESTNTCDGGLIVKVNTLYWGWGITATQTWTRGFSS